MLHHVISVRFREDASEDDKQAMADGLLGLPQQIDVIRSIKVGRDLRIRADNFDFTSLMEFDNEASYLYFRDHPAHQHVVERYIRPVIVERAGVLFSWP